MWKITIKTPEEEPREHTLQPGITKIGRSDSNDIVLDISSASRHHAEISYDADMNTVRINDLGSTNGSAVNGEIALRLPLTNNDVIAVGDVRIIYTSKGAAESQDIDLDATDTFEIPDYDEPSSESRIASALGKQRET